MRMEIIREIGITKSAAINGIKKIKEDNIIHSILWFLLSLILVSIKTRRLTPLLSSNIGQMVNHILGIKLPSTKLMKH